MVGAAKVRAEDIAGVHGDSKNNEQKEDQVHE